MSSAAACSLEMSVPSLNFSDPKSSSMFIIFGDCGGGVMQCNTMKCVVGCNRNKKNH
jgi:hypothetical protein